MTPQVNLITLKDNRQKIQQLLTDLVLAPRIKAIEWSRITKQTPNMKIGYPGQHLASLITGIHGEKTGARGNDLKDGSEVKSCSRIDQLDKCNECGAGVARLEDQCGDCNSGDIKRNNDSKWLFTIRSEDDLNTLLHRVGRVVLVLGDYPNFEEGDFNTLRFQAFEIWPKHPRNRRFSEIMTNYYYKIYLAHKEANSAKTPAPKNFWPDQYQFYMCNPIRTFLCDINDANTNPTINIREFVDPEADRSTLPSILMPKSLLKREELLLLAERATRDELLNSLPPGATLPNNASKDEILERITGINEKLREHLSLRDTDRISTAKTAYSRRRHESPVLTLHEATPKEV